MRQASIHLHISDGARTPYAVDHNGCWVWQGAVDHNGYGMMAGGARGKTRRAHRIFYEAAHGPIPAGFHVHHRCENKPCVNPDHLEAVHPAEHLHGHMVELKRVLTDEQRAEIRELGRDRTNLIYDVADRYGVSKSYVDYIWKGGRFDEGNDGPIALDPTPCRGCGEPIGPERTRKARFCTKACKDRYNKWKARERRKAAA